MFSHLRIARPVTHLERSVGMYVHGLGLQVLDRFENHAGFDGVMLGGPDLAFHFEFTYCHHHQVTPSPTPEDLIVIYLPEPGEWDDTCARMLDAGFERVRAFNPYWETHGRTFVDPDGYRVVVQKLTRDPVQVT